MLKSPFKNMRRKIKEKKDKTKIFEILDIIKDKRIKGGVMISIIPDVGFNSKKGYISFNTEDDDLKRDFALINTNTHIPVLSSNNIVENHEKIVSILTESLIKKGYEINHKRICKKL